MVGRYTLKYLSVSNSQNCSALLRHSLFAANSVNDSDKTETRVSGALRYSIQFGITLRLTTDTLTHRRAHTKFGFGRRHDTSWRHETRRYFYAGCSTTDFHLDFSSFAVRFSIEIMRINTIGVHKQYINQQSLYLYGAYRVVECVCGCM